MQAQTPVPYAASAVLHLPEDTDNSHSSWPQTSITLIAPSVCILQDLPVASCLSQSTRQMAKLSRKEKIWRVGAMVISLQKDKASLTLIPLNKMAVL